MTELEWLDLFSDNLVSLMDEARMSQVKLALEAGLSESSISYYVNKQKVPGIRAIVNLSYALDCSIDELIDFGESID